MSTAMTGAISSAKEEVESCSRKGNRIHWSFLVNGPLKRSKRTEPVLRIVNGSNGRSSRRIRVGKTSVVKR